MSKWTKAVKKIKVKWQEYNWLERPLWLLLLELLPRIGGVRSSANFNFIFSRAGCYLLSNSSSAAAAASSGLSLLFIVWFVSLSSSKKREKEIKLVGWRRLLTRPSSSVPMHQRIDRYLGHMNVQSLLLCDIKEKRRAQIQKLLSLILFILSSIFFCF